MANEIITYICAADHAVCKNVLEDAGILVRDEEDNLTPATGLSMVEIGTLFDRDSPDHEEPVALIGYHCNILGALNPDQVAGIADVEVFPVRPQVTV